MADKKNELRDKGLRLTPQRELVLQAVRELGHATPEEVAEKVRTSHPGINLSTVYRTFVKPRLQGDIPTEDVRPPQFAQIVGFLFALTATAALVLDATAIFTVAISFALAAAFLNAVFNYCLGCEMYLLIARARGAVSGRKNSEDSYNLPNL